MQVTKIFLVGLPGSGKSTLGKELADKLSFEFVDLDEQIVSVIGMSIPEYFKFQGEVNFRMREHEALVEECSSKDQFVMATGGGAPCFHFNMDLMTKQGSVIYLDVSPGDLALRILEDGVEKRPKFSSYDQQDLIQEIRELKSKREQFYNQAQIKIRDNRISVDKIISNLESSF